MISESSFLPFSLSSFLFPPSANPPPVFKRLNAGLNTRQSFCSWSLFPDAEDRKECFSGYTVPDTHTHCMYELRVHAPSLLINFLEICFLKYSPFHQPTLTDMHLRSEVRCLKSRKGFWDPMCSTLQSELSPVAWALLSYFLAFLCHKHTV